MNEPKPEFGEPWKVTTVPTSVGCCHQIDTNICIYDDGRYVGEKTTAKEKAERIVQCVNFCASVPNEELAEAISLNRVIGSEPIWSENFQMKQQLAAKDAEIGWLANEFDELNDEISTLKARVTVLNADAFEASIRANELAPYLRHTDACDIHAGKPCTCGLSALKKGEM